ncbi:hypothetical protein tloyanaT_21050 [Thalassotalea loyana]|uniref:Lacal_2735 family protein n=1 Tax=Thalassotalea loyana TaxID=280483 RepID=A0ABQ6HCM7_9GAMM|nr:hypothetical protein tloyanaT_21050 [Thalassotalea loyana]
MDELNNKYKYLKNKCLNSKTFDEKQKYMNLLSKVHNQIIEDELKEREVSRLSNRGLF